jgi:DNA transposition AAA+ family ATPase
MTNQIAPVKGLVALKNVAEFMAMARRLIERAPHLPGIGVCSSPSGFGKTYASIFTQNRTNAIRVEVGDTWTRRTLLRAILKELGETVRDRVPAADMADKIIIALGNEPGRPLIVDEADKLVDRNMIETIRELHEQSQAPVILIGEEKLPSKLLAVERVHNRVLHWMQAQPCDIEDTKELAAAFAPKLVISPELLDAIRAASMGRARRVVVNLSNVAEFCRNKNLTHIGVEKWGGQFYTGEPPAPRNVAAFPKKAAA